MSAQLHAGTTLADGSPARELLDELAETYRLVLVTDGSNRVRWMSEGWRSFCGSEGGVVGHELREGISKLPRPEQTFALRSELREHGVLDCAPVEIRDHQGQCRSAELTMFSLPLDDTRVPWRVVIVRPNPDLPLDAPADPLLHSAPDALIAVGEGGFITYANPAAERLLGREPGQLARRPIAALAGAPGDLAQLLSVLRTDAHRELDLTLLRREGESVAVAASASCCASEAARGRGVILALREAGRSSETERESARKIEELEHCVNALAHDLRSPLVALLGFSRLLRQDYGAQLDDTGGHFIDRIEQAGRTMEALIHDLLELSRIGQQGEHPAMVDPRTVLLQIAAELKESLDTEGIELALPSDPPLVYCDRSRLYQVFSNLVGNAIEHMGPTPAARISIDVVEEDDVHRIRVSDTGQGIDPANHERIFEAFQSLGERRDGTRGTGMGLAIVRRIAETHAGRAWVESESGDGAHFFVTLPRR